MKTDEEFGDYVLQRLAFAGRAERILHYMTLERCNRRGWRRLLPRWHTNSELGPFQIDDDAAPHGFLKSKEWFCVSGLADYWHGTDHAQRVWFTVRRAYFYSRPTPTEYVATLSGALFVCLRGNENNFAPCIPSLAEAIKAAGGRAYLGLELEE